MIGEQRPARPLDRGIKPVARAREGRLQPKREAGGNGPHQFGDMLGGQIGPHRLILAPRHQPASLGDGERRGGIAQMRIVGRGQARSRRLARLLDIRLPMLTQHQSQRRAHLHMAKQSRAEQGRPCADHRPGDRARHMVERSGDFGRMSERQAQRHLDRLRAPAQMTARFHDQRIMRRNAFFRQEKRQVDGMTDRHGGRTGHDPRHRPAARHARAGKGRSGAHAGKNRDTSLKCTKP